MKFADRLKFTATGASAAVITHSAAVLGARTLAQVITDGASDPTNIKVGDSGVPFMVVEEGTPNWEHGYYTITSTGQINRESIISSSAGSGAAVTFSGGPLTVFNEPPASWLRKVPVVTDAVFSQSIPLSQAGTVYMAPASVSGALTFTPAAAAVRGALVYLRLTADGVNTPNVAAFKEWGGSSGYDNRSGIINELQFFYDGYDYWFSASQAVGAVAAPAAATAVTLTGPASGTMQSASTNFTAGVSPVGGTITGTIVVTPNDGGAGGTFNPTSVSLTSAAPTGTFTYTASTAGAKAINVTNNGGLANPAAVTFTAAALTAPSQMAAPVATAAVNSAQVTMTAPSSNGGSAVTGYTVASIPAGGVDSAAGTTTLTRTITGLTAGTAYTFTSTATNAIGTSVASPASNSITPSAAATAPAAPTSVAATPGDTTISVTGTAPANNGSAITSYTATATPAGGGAALTVTNATLPVVITGATNGVAYNVTLRATNAIGAGPDSSPAVSATPAVPPDYPRLTGRLHMAESGTGPYTYTGDGTGRAGAVGGYTTKTLAANVDGYMDFKIITPNEVFVGFQRNTTIGGYVALDYALDCAGAASGVSTSYVRVAKTQTGVDLTTANPPATGDILRVGRRGNVFFCAIARAASPTVFTDMDTYNFGSAPLSYGYGMTANVSALQLLAWSGFA